MHAFMNVLFHCLNFRLSYLPDLDIQNNIIKFNKAIEFLNKVMKLLGSKDILATVYIIGLHLANTYI